MPSNIYLSNPTVTPLDIRLLTEALQSSSPMKSAHRTALESTIAACTGCTHAVAIASAEQALSTLLHAMGIGPGHDVILPGLGDAACIRAVRRIGSTAHFAECDPGTLMPTSRSIEAVVTPATTAVLAGHGDGWGSGLPDIAACCGRIEVPFVELVATRLGSHWATVPAGSLGRAAVVDLSTRSLMSGGEGAVIVTDDAHLADACRAGDFVTCQNAHRADPMPESTAALASAQLTRMNGIIEVCRGIAERYTVSLSQMPELLLPAMTPDAMSSWSRYIVRLDETFSFEDRDEIIRGMQRHDIHADVGLAHLPTIWNGATDGICPVAASIATRTIALPIHPELAHRDVDLICQTLQLMIQRASFRRN